LRKQVPTRQDTAELVAAAVREQIPNVAGIRAWQALLSAHASLMRRLDLQLRAETGSGLSEFDVMGQLAVAGGSLRMSDLAERAYSSRSGMTRRVDRLVAEGLLCRSPDDQDGRGVVVALTDAGVARLRRITPAHLKGVAELFVARLSETELRRLERSLSKVTSDATFG
jgi:DNA-binding MarR family transcriptional regulator